MNDLEQKRMSFLPEGPLRVLMIGESPPPGRGFFYCGDSTLYRATKPILCDRLGFPDDRERFLASFRKSGWYLEDFSTIRGDKPHLRPRAPKVVSAIQRLSDFVGQRRPTVVVGVLLEIAPLVSAVIERSECPQTPWRCLRFPYWRSRPAMAAYQEGLRELIGELDRF